MNERFKSVKRASVLGMLGNLFLLIIKAAVGLISNSQAMLADAFNSLSDIFSSIMTFVGNRIASIPSDDDHNLGHGKAEYIYSMLISIAMILMAIKAMYDSISSLIKPVNYTFSFWLVVVCLITICIKFCLFLYTHKLSKRYHNVLLNANSKDHRNDCVVTFTTLIASLCSKQGIYWVDGVVGSIISLWILLTAVKIFKESYDVLMDKSIDEETKNRVYELIKQHPEIEKVIHFNSTPVGYRYQISFTIYVDGNMTTFESHNIADKLEREIEEKIEEIYLTVIHVNPIDIRKKKKISKTKKKEKNYDKRTNHE